MEIREDIPLLVNHFSRLACSELSLPPKRFSAGALEILMQRHFPGNVRELQNLVRRVVKQFTFGYVSSLLEKNSGNVSRSAELSGLGRASLQKIMRRLGIKADSYREA